MGWPAQALRVEVDAHRRLASPAPDVQTNRSKMYVKLGWRGLAFFRGCLLESSTRGVARKGPTHLGGARTTHDAHFSAA